MALDNFMNDILDVLFRRVWWRWDAQNADWFSVGYRSFNFLECLVWLVVALLILARFARHRRSRQELLYGLAFVTFGLSDAMEAFQQSSWLIWLKLINLVALFLLRRRVMRRYPEARAF